MKCSNNFPLLLPVSVAECIVRSMIKINNKYTSENQRLFFFSFIVIFLLKVIIIYKCFITCSSIDFSLDFIHRF